MGSSRTRSIRRIMWVFIAVLSTGAAVVAAGPTAMATGNPPDARQHTASAVSSCDPADLPGGSEGPDNDGDECGFTITGGIDPPQPTGDPVQDAPSEFAQGSPQLAKTCSLQLYLEDELVGREIAGLFFDIGAPTADLFLEHFLDGSGSAIDVGDFSPLALEVKVSSLFRDANKQFQQYAKVLLDQGQQSVDVSAALHTIDFSQSIIPDLKWGFGGTQGLQVSGSGFEENGRYVGTITYKIQDIYGFYAKEKFHGIGPRMHYLQGICGAPYFPGGAHWFPDSVTVTVDFNQPIG